MFLIKIMRTTLEIEGSVLDAAREAAALSKRTMGEVISQWARRGMAVTAPESGKDMLRNGMPVFGMPAGTPVVTTEIVKRLLADEDLPARH
jgi:hypothetical protein